MHQESAQKVFNLLPSVIKHFSKTNITTKMKERLNFLKSLVHEGFDDWYTGAPDDKCPLSGKFVYLWEFTSAKQLREYVMSGMCKAKQDTIYEHRARLTGFLSVLF